MMPYFSKTGFFLYKNLKTMQNDLTFEAFDKFLQKQKFDNVVEIGTAFGGLYLFLCEKSVEYNYNFVSFDIVDRIQNENLKGRKILNVFSDQSVDIIKTDISSGKTLILCDGGNKIKEFNYFSELLKPGDYIMAHDYAESIEYFNENINNVYWNWCEIKDIDISKSLEKLKKYNDVDFVKCAWLCCEK